MPLVHITKTEKIFAAIAKGDCKVLKMPPSLVYTKYEKVEIFNPSGDKKVLAWVTWADDCTSWKDEETPKSESRKAYCLVSIQLVPNIPKIASDAIYSFYNTIQADGHHQDRPSIQRPYDAFRESCSEVVPVNSPLLWNLLNGAMKYVLEHYFKQHNITD